MFTIAWYNEMFTIAVLHCISYKLKQDKDIRQYICTVDKRQDNTNGINKYKIIIRIFQNFIH